MAKLSVVKSKNGDAATIFADSSPAILNYSSKRPISAPIGNEKDG
jgi:hypothetical protein